MRTWASFIIAILSLFVVLSAIADVPRLITYQGRLTDDIGDPVADGSYIVVFAIFEDSTAGSSQWKETQTVTVENGLFNVQLGTVEILPASIFENYSDLFLAMSIDGMPQMEPRTRLTSAAFCYHALTVADDAITSEKIQDGSIQFADIGQNGAADGQVMRWKSPAWIPYDLPNGDISKVTAGDGLTGGGTSGDVTLDVGVGFGLIVTASEVSMDKALVEDRYVNAEGDSMTGSLIMDDPATGDNLIFLGRDTESSGKIETFSYYPGYESQKVSLGGTGNGTLDLHDRNGDITVKLRAQSSNGGLLELRQEDGTQGVKLHGGNTSYGARIYMYTAGNNLKVKLDAEDTGDDAARLPDSSVSAAEMQNEPGIVAHNHLEFLTWTTSMTDLDTVSITIPTAGYIHVEGRCYAYVHGSTNYSRGVLQIDETAGGAAETPYYAIVGQTGSGTSSGRYFPVYLSRIYYKTVGTYKFRVEGYADPLNFPDAEIQSNCHMMTATFYPTSYGSVSTLVSPIEAERFDNATSEQATNSHLGENTTTEMYRVDLRELELKAARARAAVEQAEHELLQARMVEMKKNQELNDQE